MELSEAANERTVLMGRAIELMVENGPVIKTLADTQGLRIALAQVLISNEDGSPNMLRAFQESGLLNTQIDTVIALVMAAMED